MRAVEPPEVGHAPSPLSGWGYPHPLAGENWTIKPDLYQPNDARARTNWSTSAIVE
jgi:hypothetical protein